MSVATNLRRRVERARSFPKNTCPASRHLHNIGDTLSRSEAYPMLAEDPVYCGETMLSVVESLWKARTKIAKLERDLSYFKTLVSRPQP